MNQTYVTYTNSKIAEKIANHPVAREIYKKGMEMATTDEERECVVTLCMQIVPETIDMLSNMVYARIRDGVTAD